MALWPDYVPAALALLPTCQAAEVPGLMYARTNEEDRNSRDSRFAGIAG